MKNCKYDVFISYARRDYRDANNNVIPGNAVSKVKEALTQAGFSFWFDEEGIYSGQNFVQKIVNNIEASQIFVFLSTENANKSPWTCKEIASAYALHKYIIPVRIDSSEYNKKVLFYLADIDYVDYITNPQKGLEQLVESIKVYVAEVQAEEKFKEQEKLKRKALETKRLQEAQENLIANIEASCKMLENEASKIELERSNLLLKTEKVIDENRREALQKKIIGGSHVHQITEKERQSYISRIEALSRRIEELKQQVRFERNIKTVKLKYKWGVKTWGLFVGLLLMVIAFSLRDKQPADTNDDKELVNNTQASTPQFVDLGLKVKWATCNLGAESPEESGDYYAWGEAKSRTNAHTFETAPYYLEGNSSSDVNNSKYNASDKKVVLDKTDDIAFVTLGGSWRMPTQEDFRELIDACIWTWSFSNGIKGYKITGPNGNSIFLPAVGDRYEDEIEGNTKRGIYLTSSLYDPGESHAWGVRIDGKEHFLGSAPRFIGYSIRPVHS